MMGFNGRDPKPSRAALFLCASIIAIASPSLSRAEGAASPGIFSLSPSKSELRVGDRVKLSFYERLDSDEEKWRTVGGRSIEVPRDFHERGELTGEYAIQDDGNISLPMLGRFPAANQPIEAMLTSIRASFEELIGRKGFVNLLTVSHQPIYVVGPVKNPGAFPFEPGLTPLHATALAGGLRQEATENWQRVETGREMEQLQKSLERVKRLIARTFVLKAERDGSQAPAPELASLVGTTALRELSADESAQRQLVQISRDAQDSALLAEVTNARSELAARGTRVGPLDDAIKLHVERVKGMQSLVEKNVVGKTVLIQAQSELSDLEDRRSQALLEMEASKERLAQAERELLKAKTETKVEIARAIAAAEQDGNDMVAESLGSLNLIKTMATSKEPAADGKNISYEIVRRTGGGVITLNLSEMSLLEPGDLVRIGVKDEHDGSQVAGQ